MNPYLSEHKIKMKKTFCEIINLKVTNIVLTTCCKCKIVKYLHIKSSKGCEICFSMKELSKYLQIQKTKLNGEWIKKNSNYEQEACNKLGFDHQSARYWDSKYKDSYIEIKKGKSIWLDEIRYSEILLGINSYSKIDTITMFLIPEKSRTKIDVIYLINSKKLIKFLKIDANWAIHLLERKDLTTRSINYQQNMTLSDLKKIADYII